MVSKTRTRTLTRLSSAASPVVETTDHGTRTARSEPGRSEMPGFMQADPMADATSCDPIAFRSCIGSKKWLYHSIFLISLSFLLVFLVILRFRSVLRKLIFIFFNFTVLLKILICCVVCTRFQNYFFAQRPRLRWSFAGIVKSTQLGRFQSHLFALVFLPTYVFSYLAQCALGGVFAARSVLFSLLYFCSFHLVKSEPAV